MNNHVPATRDVDPLGYGLTNFHNFESYDNLPFPEHGPTCNVKQELYQTPYLAQLTRNDQSNGITQNQNNDKPPPVPQPAVSNADTNEDIKPDVFNMRKTKIKRERSKYFSEKITDKDFKFYGCTLCNIAFPTLQELDTHVLIHKERVTSYDLRIKSRIRKKKMLKELLKKEKMKDSIKTEDLNIEIKPEDGYIGNQKASDVINTESDNQSSKENKNSSKKIKSEKKGKGKKMNNKDDELKIYKCFGCEKQFTLSYYLKLHVRSHTDEKPYTCAQCGQSFITASKLGRHNKRFHLAIRYQCRICYRYFSRFEFLTHHFDKKHSDDKLEGEPYDFNAILPYLKELEEQMQEKNEIKEKEKDSLKIEDIWNDSGTEDHCGKNIKIDVQIEEVKVDMGEIEVKIEAKDEEIKNEDPEVNDSDTKGADDNSGDKNDNNDDYFGDRDDVKEESDVKDENLSDEDYFPLNTWASTPKVESPPPTPKPKDKLQCSVCQKKISTVSYLKVHMRTHTGERPFKCYVCNAGFITSSKMHRHVLTHPESVADGKIKSEKDEIKSENEKDENDEDNKDNKPLKKIKKSMEKFSKKSRGIKKEKLYKKRPHACDFCHKRFLHPETLQVHKKSHEGETKSYECKFCLTPQEDAATLETHEATHTGAKPYLCTICGKSYKNRESMVYHRKNHKPEKEFQCDICTKSFNAQCKLQRHIVSHRVDRFILRYECPVCAHMFNTKYHMQMHLNTHQKEGLIQEENRNEILAMVLQNARKIPKKPDTSASLTDIVPNDERSRVCNICGEVFQHFYYLEEHLKSHGSKIAIEDSEKEEEKKHICKVCNKGFKLHYYLKLHSFTHTKEKPFICQQCGKGFITRGKLKRHLETHTGLKKYQCHICYKFFTRPSYLRIHVRTIHGTQDYNFRLDKVEYSSSVHDGQL